MSSKYPGGIISKTAPTPSGPYEADTAPGIWTLEQQAYWQKLGQWPTQGNVPLYIEDVYSTYLYTGNGSTQTITNGIDLSTKGGLIWQKTRPRSTNHFLTDSARGFDFQLATNSSDAQVTRTGVVTPTTSGFSLNGTGGNNINYVDESVVSWTFRKQPKFFDVVTYTGDGTSSKAVPHNLGSVPGCMIVKKTSASGTDWSVYHRSLGNGGLALLNDTIAAFTSNSEWAFTTPTSTAFYVNGVGGDSNTNGASYVAYLFAHNAGGFGLTGTDNVISCGSVVSTGGVVDVNLGYEPQWVLMKNASNIDAWYMYDTMREMSLTNDRYLRANSSAAEGSFGGSYISPTSTGLKWDSSAFGASGETYIYIVIRRGPMKVPTSGTEVFDVGTRSGSGSVAKTNSDILTDLAVIKRYTSAAEYWAWTPRLVGNQTLQSNSTDAELSGAMATNPWDTMTGAFCAASNGATNTSTLVDYSFKRAPGYHDVVCYTGTGVPATVTHGLTVIPELIILKRRNNAEMWPVYAAPLGATKYLILNTQDLATTDDVWNNTSPTASVFSVNSYAGWNASGSTYVAYLFATCAGVSKVGSYTGTGALQTINCGFTGGARFVLIKRTDVAGGWYIYDSANGISSGNDPYLLVNSTAAQVTGTNYVDTDTTGFKVTAAAPSGLNASGGTFIFLAIA